MAEATKRELDVMAVADRLRPTLLQLARELRREKIAGVSPHQVGLLVAIKYAPGVTVGELATDERVSTAAMSKRVSRLERDGLVTRKHDSGDRRMMLIHLTPKGQAALEAVLPGHFKQMAAQMAPLNEHERKTLVRLLNKVAGQERPAPHEARAHLAAGAA